jgi:hypothetical protein
LPPDTLLRVPEKEHPAAKAGRFVRVAGKVISREVERQSAAAAAKAAAPPPPPPPPPRPVPTKDLIGRFVFVTFLAALIALLLAVLHVYTLFDGHTVRLVFRLVLASLLFLEAFLLTSNWHLGNQRVGQRLLNKVWGPRGAMNRREKTFARLVRDALTLVGIGFLAAGAFELLSATVGY